jgi:hypothetical protein
MVASRPEPPILQERHPASRDVVDRDARAPPPRRSGRRGSSRTGTGWGARGRGEWIFQIGLASTATNYEGSGIFYDNINLDFESPTRTEWLTRGAVEALFHLDRVGCVTHGPAVPGPFCWGRYGSAPLLMSPEGQLRPHQGRTSYSLCRYQSSPPVTRIPPESLERAA